jgi:hypothetical protein
MEVSGKYHISGFMSGERPPIPTGQEAGWVKSQSKSRGKRKISSCVIFVVQPVAW